MTKAEISSKAVEAETSYSMATSLTTELKTIQRHVKKILDNSVVAGFMMIVTLFVLFSDDSRVSAADKSADNAFSGVETFCFFLFAAEIFLQCIVYPEYVNLPVWKARAGETTVDTWLRRCTFGSFYFWLDWVSTLTILMDVPWALGSVVNGTSGVKSAKAVRLVRLVRMVRLIRLVKLYKYSQKAKKKNDDAGDKEKPEEDSTVTVVLEESNVGAAMSDITNKRVLVLILIMLIVIPLLTMQETDQSGELSANVLHAIATSTEGTQEAYDLALDFAREKLPGYLQQIVYVNVFSINNSTVMQSFVDQQGIDECRDNEIIDVVLKNTDFITTVKISIKKTVQNAANFSIGTTIFVMFLLLGATFAFSSDVDNLVIRPIEKMVALVKMISADPLGVNYDKMSRMEGFEVGMETTILLSTITKIGTLMRVGFGEAGASVIAKNLKGSTGKLRLFGAGTTITSIFGFCDVRQFTDTTECLQEEVMLFVNRIAHILHSIIVQCSGSANKNIGDAFLLTWKLESNFSAETKSKLADQALLAFCKAHIELSRYQAFICNFSALAMQRLYKRFPEYAVRLGTGLHVGWAIEGAIGSDHKIDATYLSPHVNMSEFLESQTKEYGVSLLISEPFYRLLSPTAAKFCRQVDRVKRNDREGPIGIYCYDTDLTIDWNNMILHKKHDVSISGPRRGSVATPSHVSSDLQDSTPEQSALRPSNDGSGSGTRTREGRDNSASTQRRRKKPHHKLLKGPTGIGALKRQGSRAVLATILDDDEETPNDERMRIAAERALKPPVIAIPPYDPILWMDDTDLVALRHRVDDKFRAIWGDGIAAYVKGDWQKARDIFQETLSLSKNMDGPSKFLIAQIDEHHGAAPENWPGYRDLNGGGH